MSCMIQCINSNIEMYIKNVYKACKISRLLALVVKCCNWNCHDGVTGLSMSISSLCFLAIKSFFLLLSLRLKKDVIDYLLKGSIEFDMEKERLNNDATFTTKVTMRDGVVCNPNSGSLTVNYTYYHWSTHKYFRAFLFMTDWGAGVNMLCIIHIILLFSVLALNSINLAIHSCYIFGNKFLFFFIHTCGNLSWRLPLIRTERPRAISRKSMNPSSFWS